MRDVHDLLQEARPREVGPPDLDRIEQRATRRRAVKTTGLTLVVAALAVTAALGLVTDNGPDAPIVDEPSVPAPSDDAPVPTPANDATPWADAPVLSIASFPVLGQEGVAVDTADGVVFLDLGGRALGRLPGAVLGRGLVDPVPGLVYVTVTETGRSYWLDARNGASLDAEHGTPVGSDGLLVIESREPERDTIVLAGDAGRLGSYGIEADPKGPNWISANHDVFSWIECGPDAPGPTGCERVHIADFDRGTATHSDNGCWVTDKRDQVDEILSCGPDGGTWLWVPFETPDEPLRVDVPTYDGAPGPFGRWELALFASHGGIVAELGLECETSRVVGVHDGQVYGLFGTNWADGPNAHLVGATLDGTPVVHVTAGECDEPTEHARGVYLLVDGGALTPIAVHDSVTDAQYWTTAPSIPEVKARHDLD